MVLKNTLKKVMEYLAKVTKFDATSSINIRLKINMKLLLLL